LLADLAAAVPELAACEAAWPKASASRPATLPHRSSGRTAATAHLDVREPRPPQHHDSPFGATMEGADTALPWVPGWNSVQVLQKGPGLDRPDIFLLEDRPTQEIHVPEPILPDDRQPGMEELSSLSPALIAYRQARAT
jgi:hypothetical protein